MRTLLGFFLLGLGGILVQAALAPRLLPLHLTPDLLLILVIYLGLYRPGVSGGLTAFMLGLLQDSFAGCSLGLYGLVFLTLFLILHGLSERLNTDNPILLLFMVLCGSLLQAAIMAFVLGFLSDTELAWRTIFRTLPLQTLLNLVSASLMLGILGMLRKTRPRKGAARQL